VRGELDVGTQEAALDLGVARPERHPAALREAEDGDAPRIDARMDGQQGQRDGGWSVLGIAHPPPGVGEGGLENRKHTAGSNGACLSRTAIRG